MFWNKQSTNSYASVAASAPSGCGADDFFNSGRPLLFNSVDFRDGHQSLFATRMTTAHMVPVLTAMDNIGYDSMEMWGGATFDVGIRFLDDDPWERLRTFKRYVKKTPLKMVLRGQNLVGYKAYPDDIVEKFIEKAAENGIDIFLIFDALSDLRNCEVAFRAVKKAGKKLEGSIQYNISPYHTINVMVEDAKNQVSMGCEALHVEDMAGLLTPQVAYELIKAIKSAVDVPVHLHCHCTGGMAEMAYWEAIRAGVDGLDVCVSSLSLGPAHPPIETFATALKGTSRDPHIDVAQFGPINDHILKVRKAHAAFETNLVGVDVGCLQHQVPGGMLSNLEGQLKQMNAYDRLQDVLDEVIRVRADMGYPPLATPSSQMCGAQATMNVLNGKRYGIVPQEMKNYCRGMYGMPPGPISEELTKAAIGEEEPDFRRPGEKLEPAYEQMKKEIGTIAKTEEDVLTYCLFPEQARPFLKKKYAFKDC